MPDPVKVYNLGDIGVNVDSSPVNSDDPQVIQATNAIFDRRGNEGALAKRPALMPLNGIALDGAVRGIFNVNLTSPGAGGGGGGGGSFTAPNGIYVFTVDTLFAQRGYISYDGLAFAPGIVLPTDPLLGIGRAVSGAGRFFYSAIPFSSPGYLSALRVWDGEFDTTLVTYVDDLAVLPRGQFEDLLLSDGYVYAAMSVSYWDDGGGFPPPGGISTGGGAVYAINVTNGQVRQLGEVMNNQVVPTYGTGTIGPGGTVVAVGLFNGRVWSATFSGISGSTYIRSISLSGTSWTDELTLAGSRQLERRGFCVYHGTLYAATFGAAPSTGIVYSCSGSGAGFTAADTGGTDDRYHTPVVFDDKLFVFRSNTVTGDLIARVYDGSSWSTDHDFSTDWGAAPGCIVSSCNIIGGVLYVTFDGNVTSGLPLVMKRTTGGVWSVVMNTQVANESLSMLAVVGA